MVCVWLQSRESLEEHQQQQYSSSTAVQQQYRTTRCNDDILGSDSLDLGTYRKQSIDRQVKRNKKKIKIQDFSRGRGGEKIRRLRRNICFLVNSQKMLWGPGPDFVVKLKLAFKEYVFQTCYQAILAIIYSVHRKIFRLTNYSLINFTMVRAASL